MGVICPWVLRQKVKEKTFYKETDNIGKGIQEEQNDANISTP